MGCAIDHGSPGTVGVFGLPNRMRSASASVVTGFHSAITRITVGIVLVGTNVLATKVIGNRTANAMPVTPSGVAITLPIRMPTQIIAKENAASSAYPASASPTLLWILQPIARPLTDIRMIGSRALARLVSA